MTLKSFWAVAIIGVLMAVLMLAVLVIPLLRSGIYAETARQKEKILILKYPMGVAA